MHVLAGAFLLWSLQAWAGSNVRVGAITLLASLFDSGTVINNLAAMLLGILHKE